MLEASKKNDSDAVKLLALWKSNAEKNRVNFHVEKERGSSSGLSLHAANGKSQYLSSIYSDSANGKK